MLVTACLASCTQPVQDHQKPQAEDSPKSKITPSIPEGTATPSEQNMEAIMAEAAGFDEANLTRLNSKEIENLVRGTLIEIHLDSAGKVVPFGERFSSDGEWFGSLQSRVARNVYGEWSVQDNSLCVSTLQHGKICRPVWKSDNEGQYFIVPYFDALAGREKTIAVTFANQG